MLAAPILGRCPIEIISDARTQAARTMWEAQMQSPSGAGFALMVLVLAAVVWAVLPDKSHTDRSARSYLPQLISQSR
jgi:hypothetical protein